MTDTTNELRLPIPLDAFLDAGGDLPTALGRSVWDCFQDEILTALEIRPGRAEETASWLREWALDAIEGRKSSSFGVKLAAEAPDGKGWVSLQHYVTTLSWHADVLEKPGLAERLLDLCTEAERQTLLHRLDVSLRPHPLLVEVSSGRCDACGDAVQGPGLAIGHRIADDGSEETDAAQEGPWCFSCVSIAYEAMKAAQS